jgi:hypothetical protein
MVWKERPLITYFVIIILWKTKKENAKYISVEMEDENYPFWIIKRTVGMISFLSRTDSSGSVLIYDFAFSNYRG